MREEHTIVTGIHHCTICVGAAQEDIDFMTKVIGQRMIKQTVLFDGTAPIYHLYYANKNAEIGTVMTTFPFKQAGVFGRRGTGARGSRPRRTPSSGPFCSARRPSAVHGDRGAGDERGGRGAQVRQELGDLLRLDQPLDRRAGQHDPLDHLGLGDAVGPGLVGDLALDQRRAHVAGVDAVGRSPRAGAPSRAITFDRPSRPCLAVDIGRLVGRRRAARAPRRP